MTIRYDATMNAAGPAVTSGTWSIVASTLVGATVGNGQVTGQPDACEPLAGADACILDTLAGTVAA